jgi:hypothetical protein
MTAAYLGAARAISIASRKDLVAIVSRHHRGVSHKGSLADYAAYIPPAQAVLTTKPRQSLFT